MAAKKQDKSSKTAHVLNLLTKPAPSPQPEPLHEVTPAQTQTPAPAQTPAAAPLVPPVVQNAQREENLSQQIRGALADDLAAALNEAPVADDDFGEAYFEAYDDLTEGYAQLQAEQQPNTQTPNAQTNTAINMPTNMPTNAQPPEPKPVPQPTASAQPKAEGLLYLNIMQPLVEAAAPRYAKLANLCDCPRCLADVKAYALTHLKPHYAVFRQEDSIPMLTLYETRYASQVATILMQACEVVKENPRHRFRY